MKLIRPGEPSEELIQRTIISWVNLQPSIRDFVIHIANEGKRSPSYGALMKKLGMKAGCADLFIAIPRHGYHGMWMEVKRRTGILSPNQKLFLECMGKQGYKCIVVYSIEDGIQAIDEYCFGG